MELEAKDFKKIPDSPCKKVTKKLVDYVKDNFKLGRNSIVFSYNNSNNTADGYVTFSFLCDEEEKEKARKIVDGFNKKAQEETESFYAIYKEEYMGRDVDEYEVTTGFGYGKKDFYERDTVQNINRNEASAMLNNPDAMDLYNAESGDYEWKKRHF